MNNFKEVDYSHLKEEVITSSIHNWHFKQVEIEANKHSLKLSDDDFKRLFTLHTRDKDIGWIMNVMSKYNESLTDALVSYIGY